MKKLNSQVTVMTSRVVPHFKESVFYRGEMALPKLHPMEFRSGATVASEVRRQLEEAGNTGIDWNNTRVYVNGVVLPRSVMGQTKLRTISAK